MGLVKVESFYVHPVKSLQGYKIDRANILKTGFEFDRYFTFLNSENKVVTAREIPELLLLKAFFDGKFLKIEFPNEKNVSICIEDVEKELGSSTLFKTNISVLKIRHKAIDLIAAFLRQKVSLVSIDSTLLRNVKEQYNGKANDVITLSDVAPIHLINKNSVAFLNSKLKEKVTELQFRPNIIVSGVPAFEEENWKYITIGDCEFEVITSTPRCSLITIDINTAQKIENQEPLRTLSALKKDKKVNFGIYMVPRKLGHISMNNEIKVIK